jgi:hypothetical protein
LEKTGAKPLLWTTTLMAPEAYTLAAAMEKWVKKESDENIHNAAAQAYSKYQKCSVNAARKLLVSGW